MLKFLLMSLLVVTLIACGKDNTNMTIEENTLGLIDANVESEETNLKTKAMFYDNTPGMGVKFDRAFENAPPMIPHTTQGFLPIKAKNNICLSCHMPDKAEEVGAVPLPETHFTKLRPDMINNNGILSMVPPDKLTVKKMEDFNFAYFNCTQCHAGQTRVTIDIKNLFTPEFRKEFDIERSNLIDKIEEGIK